MYIIFGTLAGGVASVAPFIHCIEAGTAVGAAVFTAFQLQIENVGVGFRAVAVMTFCTAIIGDCATADADTAFIVVIIFLDGRLRGLFRFHRLGFSGFCGLRLGRLCRLGLFGCDTAAVIRDFFGIKGRLRFSRLRGVILDNGGDGDLGICYIRVGRRANLDGK